MKKALYKYFGPFRLLRVPGNQCISARTPLGTLKIPGKKLGPYKSNPGEPITSRINSIRPHLRQKYHIQHGKEEQKSALKNQL